VTKEKVGVVTRLDRTQRVLLVEDDEDCGDVARCVVEMLGHTCVVARTGRDALSCARVTELDVAVIDLGLPDVSGYELARALRACRAQLHLVALSGFSDLAHRTRAYEAGFDEYFVKPASMSTFAKMVAGPQARACP
jgi:DNA-binding response OmpR family regulator